MQHAVECRYSNFLKLMRAALKHVPLKCRFHLMIGGFKTVNWAWVNKNAMIGYTWLFVYESACRYEGRMIAALISLCIMTQLLHTFQALITILFRTPALQWGGVKLLQFRHPPVLGACHESSFQCSIKTQVCFSLQFRTYNQAPKLQQTCFLGCETNMVFYIKSEIVFGRLSAFKASFLYRRTHSFLRACFFIQNY